MTLGVHITEDDFQIHGKGEVGSVQVGFALR